MPRNSRHPHIGTLHCLEPIPFLSALWATVWTVSGLGLVRFGRTVGAEGAAIIVVRETPGKEAEADQEQHEHEPNQMAISM